MVDPVILQVSVAALDDHIQRCLSMMGFWHISLVPAPTLSPFFGDPVVLKAAVAALDDHQVMPR